MYRALALAGLLLLAVILVGVAAPFVGLGTARASTAKIVISAPGYPIFSMTKQQVMPIQAPATTNFSALPSTWVYNKTGYNVTLTLNNQITYYDNSTVYKGGIGKLNSNLAGVPVLVVLYLNGSLAGTKYMKVNGSNEIKIAGIKSGTKVRVLLNETGFAGQSIVVGDTGNVTVSSDTDVTVYVGLAKYYTRIPCGSKNYNITVVLAWTWWQAGYSPSFDAIINDVEYNASGHSVGGSWAWPMTLAGPLGLNVSGLYTHQGWIWDESLPLSTSSDWPEGNYSISQLLVWETAGLANGSIYTSSTVVTFSTSPSATFKYGVLKYGYNAYIGVLDMNGTGPANLVGAWMVLGTESSASGTITTGNFYAFGPPSWGLTNFKGAIFVPKNWTTGWVVFPLTVNLSLNQVYAGAAELLWACNLTRIPVGQVPLFNGTYYNVSWGYPAYSAVVGFNSSYINMSFNYWTASEFGSDFINVLEWMGSDLFNNVSKTGELYLNVTEGYLPIFPVWWKPSAVWKVTLPSVLKLPNGVVLGKALSTPPTIYINWSVGAPKFKASFTPPAMAFAPNLTVLAWRLSNSTSSTAYVYFKVLVVNPFTGTPVPNGTVELVVNNGNTNVYTGNITVSGGVASAVLSLSPSVNYTVKALYYNASTYVLPSSVSGVEAEGSVVPSSLPSATVQVSSTTTTTTTTTTSTTTWFIILIVVVVLVVVIAIAAAAKGVKHAIESEYRRYVRREEDRYVERA